LAAIQPSEAQLPKRQQLGLAKSNTADGVPTDQKKRLMVNFLLAAVAEQEMYRTLLGGSGQLKGEQLQYPLKNQFDA
jgi:hypothetical protein